MMEYQDFVKELREKLIERTGYKQERIYLKKPGEHPKMEGDRLFVECARDGEDYEVFSIRVQELYKRCHAQESMLDEEVDKIMEQLERISKSNILDATGKLRDYEAAKGSLFIRPLNYNRIREELQNAVYRKVGDIALVLYMKAGEQDGCLMSFKIREEYLRIWGREKETVIEEALKNTSALYPPRIYRWQEMIFRPEYDGEAFMENDPGITFWESPYGECLSVKRQQNGAVAPFLPGVAERISELLGAGFYLAFTSIHEVMIHDERLIQPDQIAEVLKDTITGCTSEEDFLSEHVYYYDKDKKEIFMIGEE